MILEYSPVFRPPRPHVSDSLIPALMCRFPYWDGKLSLVLSVGNGDHHWLNGMANASCLHGVGSANWTEIIDSAFELSRAIEKFTVIEIFPVEEIFPSSKAEEDLSDLHTCSDVCAANDHKDYIPDFIGETGCKPIITVKRPIKGKTK